MPSTHHRSEGYSVLVWYAIEHHRSEGYSVLIWYAIEHHRSEGYSVCHYVGNCKVVI